MKKGIVILVFWLTCSFLSYGIMNAYYKHRSEVDWQILHESNRDFLGIEIGCAILGPINLGISLFYTNFCEYGIRWKWWGSV